MVLHVVPSLMMAPIRNCQKKSDFPEKREKKRGKNSQKGLSIVVILLIINAQCMFSDLISCENSLCLVSEGNFYSPWHRYGLLRAWTVHLRCLENNLLTASIRVKTQNLLKVEA